MSDQAIGPSEIEEILLAAGAWAATGREFTALHDGKQPRAAISKDLIRRALSGKVLTMLEAYAVHKGWRLDADLAALAKIFREKHRALVRLLGQLAEALAAQSIQIMLLKGADLAISTYPESLPRMMNDLDILAPSPDLPKVSSVLEGMGFVQGRIDRSSIRLIPLTPQEKAANENGHYELAPYMKIERLPGVAGDFRKLVDEYLTEFIFLPLGDNLLYAPTLDVHFNVSANIEFQDIWADNRRVELENGRSVLGQTFTAMLWFLAARAYHEMMIADRPCTRLFIDVVALVKAHGNAIDWERIVFFADKYDLHPSLFYILWHVNEFLEGAVPAFVIQHCYPARSSIRRFHDWGDFAPKLLGTATTVPLLSG